MDPIAHTLVGAALAQTGLRRGSAYGAAALIVGANLPDIDGVAILAGGDTALLMRRGVTHGVPALLVLPFLLVGFFVLWERFAQRATAAEPLRPKVLLGLSALALATHPALDWLNVYGMRWLMPFDGTWFYGDTLYIVDPWMWLVLGGAVFLHSSRRAVSLVAWFTFAAFAAFLLLGAVTGLTGAKAGWTISLAILLVLRFLGVGRDEGAGQRVARGALCLVAVYIASMWIVAGQARNAVADELVARGVVFQELMVAPVPVTPFVRDVVAQTESGYRYGRAALLPRFELDLSSSVLEPLDQEEAVKIARASADVRGFVNWARFPFAIVERSDAAVTVHLLDARYSRTPTGRFGTARVDLPLPLPLPLSESR